MTNDFDYMAILMRNTAANLAQYLGRIYGRSMPVCPKEVRDRSGSPDQLRKFAKDIAGWIVTAKIDRVSWGNYKTNELWRQLATWALGEDPGHPIYPPKERQGRRRGKQSQRPSPGKSKGFSPRGQTQAAPAPPLKTATEGVPAGAPRKARGLPRGERRAPPLPTKKGSQ